MKIKCFVLFFWGGEGGREAGGGGGGGVEVLNDSAYQVTNQKN